MTTMNQLFLVSFALIFNSPPLSAQNKVKLACYEEEGTRKTFCIDEHNVRVNGPIRASAFYEGGPKRSRRRRISSSPTVSRTLQLYRIVKA